MPDTNIEPKSSSSMSCGLSPGWRLLPVPAKEEMPFGCAITVPNGGTETAALTSAAGR